MQKLIFIRVPKTGSQTFTHSILRNLYKKKFYSDTNDAWHVTLNAWRGSPMKWTYPEEDYKKYDCIAGHFIINKYEHLNWPTVCFLRDPVERMISAFYYFAKVWDEREKVRPVGAWIEELQNFFTYTRDIVEFSSIYKNHQMTYVGNDLSKYAMVGITEEFEKSVGVFSKMFGHIITTYQTKNVNLKKSPVSVDIKKELRTHHKEEYELYNEARAKLKEYK